MLQTGIIQLPKIEDNRGNLTFIQNPDQIPFRIMRTHWVYDVPGGEVRGGHAYKRTHEFVIALSGSFDVVVHNGTTQTKHQLNRSYYGLMIPAGNWRKMENFSTNSLALILSSTVYDENDYIRNFETFLEMKSKDSFEAAANQQATETKAELTDNESILLKSKTTAYDCSVIELPKIQHDRLGNLTAVHSNLNVPFDIKRIFYLYDIPGGEDRGAHAHKACHQFLIAASGSFEVELDDGRNKRTVLLNRPNYGLHIPPGIWAAEKSFSSGAICLVLASHEYEASDYIRDYNSYLNSGE